MAIGTPTDAILTSVIGNRLDAVSREIGQTMLRTSRSPIFSEARDFVTAIFDRDLRLVAQTAYIPVLMASTPYAMRAVAERFAGKVDEGDVFVLNDPYRGNNHPPDITVLKPVFWEGEVAFWCVAKGHHADVGGGGVAGYNPGARSVWEECIRIPPAKLYVRGEANEALWDTILINVHIPFLVEGDLHCQVGACNIGERSLHKLLAKYGRDTLDGAITSLFNASEAQMRGAIRSVPAGRYSAERHIDHDGLGTRMIAVRVAIEVAEDSLTFDFSDSDPQCAGYVNSTIANTASSSYLALFTSIGSGIRINEGVLRALEIVAPPGTVVNALEPAPVTGCTISASQAIIEACWLALAQAVPERVDAAWGRWCAPATMGLNPRTGAPFGDIHFLCKGGAGASKGIDGWDHLGTVVCAGGLRSPDPELHELADPYTVLQYEFWPDSAGAGEWRGGLGTMYRFRVDAPAIGAANFGGGNRPETAPFGLEGGLPAPPHELRLHKASGETIEVDAEAFYDLGEGDVYEILQSGGGGYGDPRRRPAELVARDVRDGVVSAQAAHELYGR